MHAILSSPQKRFLPFPTVYACTKYKYPDIILTGEIKKSLNKANTEYAKKMAKAHLKSNGLGMYTPNNQQKIATDSDSLS